MSFIKQRIIAYIISGSMILFSLFSIFFHRGFNFGIDFTGGILIQVKFTKTIEVNDIRKALADKDQGNAVIQSVGEQKENQFIIKTKAEESTTDTIDVIQQALIDHFGEGSIELPFQRTELVGPAIGKDLRNLGFLLIGISILAILVYISFRFEFKFAVASIIALGHDVLTTLGIFSLFQKEINIPIIAAIMTILGYSINDTIVVFDRIRENLKKLHGEPLAYIIDVSVAETMSRTIITSLSTLFAVLSLYLWGGVMINDFAFVFIIGVVIGTYSSVYVASPVYYDWAKKG